ncbi:GNAT family N-acetyltransferase [Bacillus salitolerans]|uniref:GNAT family N-acetyltransferase n=1 Tax=Bacillus salitolerans TaxID=1437434 RepID=A0ABW4LWM1_9BACI
MNLQSTNIHLRQFQLSDAQNLLDLNRKNRVEFEAISPMVYTDSYYTLENHEQMVEKWSKDYEEKSRITFGIFINNTNQLIGSIGLYKFVPGDKYVLGYSLDRDLYGKGYMTEAVQLMVKFAFKQIGAHRIEAGVMPRNIGSAKVLEKVGFVREGIAREYLKIHDTWEDHIMYSLLEKDLIGKA